MPRFHYHALNPQQQPVSGQVEAASAGQAVTQLESEGLIVQSIGFANSPSATAGALLVEPLVANAAANRELNETSGLDVAALQRHLSRVLERAHVLAPALDAYAEEIRSHRRGRELSAMARLVERGDPAEAAAAFRAAPSDWIPLMSAAHTADPGRVLSRFLNESQHADRLRWQWRLTIAYPLIIALLAATVLVLLSFLVIPIFQYIFQDFGLKLPAMTQAVITLAAWIRSGRILIFVVVLLGAVLLARAAIGMLPVTVQHWLSDRFGTPLGRSTSLARFTQFLADLLEAELDTPSALRLAGFATPSPRLRRAAWRLAGDVRAGQRWDAEGYQPLLTATVLHAVGSEMPAAARVRLLRELSGCYTQRAHAALSWTSGVIEPLALIVIGLVVGTIVISLFLPLISLIQGLS